MPQTSTHILIEQIEQVARETDFSGVVCIHHVDSPLYQQAFGYRDLPNQLPNSPATRFGIASGTKLCTALGIGRLIDQSRLQLKTQVGELSRAYAGVGFDSRYFVHQKITISILSNTTNGEEDLRQVVMDFFENGLSDSGLT